MGYILVPCYSTAGGFVIANLPSILWKSEYGHWSNDVRRCWHFCYLRASIVHSLGGIIILNSIRFRDRDVGSWRTLSCEGSNLVYGWFLSVFKLKKLRRRGIKISDMSILKVRLPLLSPTNALIEYYLISNVMDATTVYSSYLRKWKRCSSV